MEWWKLHSECSWNERDPKTPAHEGCQQCSTVLIVTYTAWELPAVEQVAWFSRFLLWPFVSDFCKVFSLHKAYSRSWLPGFCILEGKYLLISSWVLIKIIIFFVMLVVWNFPFWRISKRFCVHHALYSLSSSVAISIPKLMHRKLFCWIFPCTKQMIYEGLCGWEACLWSVNFSWVWCCWHYQPAFTGTEIRRLWYCWISWIGCNQLEISTPSILTLHSSLNAKHAQNECSKEKYFTFSCRTLWPQQFYFFPEQFLHKDFKSWLIQLKCQAVLISWKFQKSPLVKFCNC